MLVIAHRLSTITMCDQILVLHEGRVVERGTHSDLLAIKGGRYAGMWKKQVRAQKAAEDAKALQAKADRLRRESMDSSNRRPGQDDSPASSDEDEHGQSSEQTDLQQALSVSPRSAVPGAQLSSVLSQDTGTDTQPQREALKSGTVRSPSPVFEEDQPGPSKPAGHS